MTEILKQSQQQITILNDIVRTVMQDVMIGTVSGVPFVSETDELWVYYEDMWQGVEWPSVPDTIGGEVRRAVEWLVDEIKTQTNVTQFKIVG